MHVLLSSQGSTGDIFPFIALGVALAEAGHQVRFATYSLFRNEVERASLEFVFIPPDWGQDEFAECMRRLTRARHPIQQLKVIYESGMPFAEEMTDRITAALDDCDLLVTTFLTPHFKHLAERKNVPTIVVTLCHGMVPCINHPPFPIKPLPGLPAWLAEIWNRFWWGAADKVLDTTINRIIRRTNSQRLPSLRHFLLKPADHVLVAVSPGLMEPEGHVDARFVFSGYLRWQAGEDKLLVDELDTFTADEKVPVLTFGSVTTDDDTKKMQRFLKCWPSNRKIIIQSGWAGFSGDGERSHIKFIGATSHDMLFQYASCIIHHGGAGTTASVLHSGKPGIVVPHIADQHFWASEVERLGTGVVVDRKHWPERLLDAVERVEQDESIQAHSRNVASVLKKENGPANAVRLLEEFAADWQR